MTGLDRDTSKSPDRTGVCCTGRCAPSQCETITGPSFSSLNKPDQERTPAYRDSSGSESPSGCLLCYFFRRLGGAIWGIPVGLDGPQAHGCEGAFYGIGRAQVLDLARGRLAGGIARKSLLAGFQALLRPAVVEALGDPFPTAQLGRCCPRRAGPRAQSGSSSRPNTACASYPGCRVPPSRRRLSNLWISVSSTFLSVTTMRQKSSVIQLPQFVP